MRKAEANARMKENTDLRNRDLKEKEEDANKLRNKMNTM